MTGLHAGPKTAGPLHTLANVDQQERGLLTASEKIPTLAIRSIANGPLPRHNSDALNPSFSLLATFGARENWHL